MTPDPAPAPPAKTPPAPADDPGAAGVTLVATREGGDAQLYVNDQGLAVVVTLGTTPQAGPPTSTGSVLARGYWAEGGTPDPAAHATATATLGQIRAPDGIDPLTGQPPNPFAPAGKPATQARSASGPAT